MLDTIGWYMGFFYLWYKRLTNGHYLFGPMVILKLMVSIKWFKLLCFYLFVIRFRSTDPVSQFLVLQLSNAHSYICFNTDTGSGIGYSCTMMFMPVASFDIQWPIMFFVRKVSTHLYTILAPQTTLVAKKTWSVG